MQLAQRGRWSLDEPLRNFVEHWPYGDDGPSLRQTLNHSGGFPNPIPIAWIHLEEQRPEFDRSVFVQNVLSKYSRLESPPGSRFAYSNIGYLLLGEAIARRSGQSYESYVESNILAPLRLAHGERLGFQLAPPETMATGYLRRWSWINLALGLLLDRSRFVGGNHGWRWSYFRRFYVNGAAYGGLIGNARGLSRLLQTLLAKDGPFTAELALLQELRPEERNLPSALGWFRGRLAGHAWLHHSGGGGGYYCEIRLYPRLRRASLLLSNRSAISDEQILNQLDAELLASLPSP
ncbi:MAG: beta-lactamase family protein [Leptospirales bacterium]|nr:beta-lactamase family protein [Leptospirales bacterium]